MSRIPSIVSGDLEEREYQLSMFEEAHGENSLIILPTGLGKTVLALWIAAERLEGRDGFVLFLAPSKPLCEQHAKTLSENLDVSVRVVTGETHKPVERGEAWSSSGITVATPHTVLNDLMEERLNLRDCLLIVYDEAHRAVGDYPYVEINRTYFETARHPQVLGLTASPGSDFKRLVEVAHNLKLERISIRGEWSDDVKPYVGGRSIRKVEVSKTEPILRAERALDSILKEFLGKLSKYSRRARGMSPERVSAKTVKEIMGELQSRLGRGGPRYLYHAVSLTAAILKLTHLKGLLTTQGIDIAREFAEGLHDDDTRAASLILKHDGFRKLAAELEASEGEENPKLEKAVHILQRHFCKHPMGRAMVFAEYRDTVEFLKSKLNEYPNIRAEPFIGQRGSEGMSQKEQRETLDAFERGEFDTLVSTSIGEEGIDVPATSLVVFYEPVPSAIRRIQRRGRTSRDGRWGEIQILVMEGTRDEPYYWKSLRGEKQMYEAAYKLKKILEKTENPQEELLKLKRGEQASLEKWA